MGHSIGSKLVSVRETANMLGLKETTIRAWLLARKLPRVNCGRAVRIPVDAIEQFISENTVPARKRRQTGGNEKSTSC